MYRTPSARKRKKGMQRINLIPILDAVFIFIFFLLMSANFLKIYEIQSDVPIVSSEPPPKSKKIPLALTISISKNSIAIATGVPSKVVKRIAKNKEGYDIEALHEYMIKLKKGHMDEKTAILEPKFDIAYEELIKIMDAIRVFKDTDEALFEKDKDGLNKQVEFLFNNIIFGNILS